MEVRRAVSVSDAVSVRVSVSAELGRSFIANERSPLVGQDQNKENKQKSTLSLFKLLPQIIMYMQLGRVDTVGRAVSKPHFL